MSKKQQKTARFFCEFCDYEVPIEARFCPRCGHFFASVRCPVCGKTGDQNLFKHGCPKCGYGSSPSTQTKHSDAVPETVKKERRKLHLPRFNASINLPEGRKASTEPLPLWIYIVVLFLVLGILLLAEAVL